jgi:hypothetical protein
MLDYKDFLGLEGEVLKLRKDGPKVLKDFLAGDRFKAWAAHTERTIKGPFYFGDSPSYADWYVATFQAMAEEIFWDPVKSKPGLGDVFASMPKLMAIRNALVTPELVAKVGKPFLPGSYMIKPDELNSFD